MADDRPTGRRRFLASASLLTVGVAAAGAIPGCADPAPGRSTDAADEAARPAPALDRTLLAAVAGAVLPASLGPAGIAAATDRFVAWVAGYEPVAEEMHGYGYADVRYLPPDPAPAWRAQLDGLDRLARRMHRRPLADLPVADRRAVIAAALRSERGDRLPAPLTARHVAVALLAHWAASPAAWDLAHGARIVPLTCRPLADAAKPPRPLDAPGAPA